MRKIYQKDWFGIRFSDFYKTDSSKIADTKFYEEFYKKFYDKFSSYDDLPEHYKECKINIAKDIINFSKDYDKVLSIGCGNGIIEDFLINSGKKCVTAIEPSDNSRWLSSEGGGVS
ncbi:MULTISPECIES: hypothetical protein [unclassified Campylobacter]|uniref:hypothetical protein n=1 Tax=unclassified Campylobacter TaxID=2593542 RepID=UPI003D359085